jgi:hypothetical protein
MRARASGYRAVCLEEIFVHHFGQSSFGKQPRIRKYGELLAEDKQRFEEKWDLPWQPYGRPKPRYDELVERIRKIVSKKLPADKTVLVVSRGDQRLLDLGNRRAWHFPEAKPGVWLGHHPIDSPEAVTHLEAMRERGGQFLLFPRTGLWWLEHYGGLREHLESRYEAVVRDEETCVIFALNRNPVLHRDRE